MKPATMNKLIWLLIYSGLLLLIIGLFVRPQSAFVGWLLIVMGAADAAAGCVFIWWRSRIRD